MQTHITDRAARFLPDGGHTELRVQENSTRRMSMINGSIAGNSASTVSGVCARSEMRGVWGYASMAECSEDAAAAAIRAAVDNAHFMAHRAGRDGKGIADVPRESIIVPERCFYTGEDRDTAAFMRELDSLILKICPKLCGRSISVVEESIEKELAVTDGVPGHTAMRRSYVYVFLTAEGNSGQPLELFRAFGGFGAFSENFSDPALLESGIAELYSMLMDKCSGVYAEAGEKTVILDGALAGMLAHEAVGHTVEADLVLGGSVAAHSLDCRVASELVNMTDFAHTAFGETVPLPVYLDDEGTPAVDSVLIRDGILVGYMNSRESAAHFGMKPQGNARAFSFSDEPLIRMRNTAVLPGHDKLSDMIASVDDGYYLVSTKNGQADTTGEFMFGISMGYEIKHGRLGRAILDTTISGVAFEMLKTVDMVSDTMKWESSGYCGKKQPMPVGLGGPDLRCRVTVGGR